MQSLSPNPGGKNKACLYLSYIGKSYRTGVKFAYALRKMSSKQERILFFLLATSLTGYFYFIVCCNARNSM